MANNKVNLKANNKQFGIGLSYAYNLPLFLIVAFLFVVILYNLLHAYRDREEVIKHKVNTEIKKKLYY